ncbi:hypothetical protein THALO_460147 [Tenacibaculum halocynthiae]
MMVLFMKLGSLINITKKRTLIEGGVPVFIKNEPKYFDY